MRDGENDATEEERRDDGETGGERGG